MLRVLACLWEKCSHFSRISWPQSYRRGMPLRFVSVRLVSFRFVSIRFVSFRFDTILYYIIYSQYTSRQSTTNQTPRNPTTIKHEHPFLTQAPLFTGANRCLIFRRKFTSHDHDQLPRQSASTTKPNQQ